MSAATASRLFVAPALLVIGVFFVLPVVAALPEEGLDDQLVQIRRDPGTRVPDAQLERVVRQRDGEQHLAAVRELDRVAEKVREDEPDKPRVAE